MDGGQTSTMRVLIVEDELKMASLLHRGLVEEGHAADVAPTGEDAVWMAQSHPYEAIVLDVMLPGVSGFETCRQLRNAGVWAPVLMLTARDGVEDRVAGLDPEIQTAQSNRLGGARAIDPEDIEKLDRCRRPLLFARRFAIEARHFHRKLCTMRR